MSSSGTHLRRAAFAVGLLSVSAHAQGTTTGALQLVPPSASTLTLVEQGTGRALSLAPGTTLVPSLSPGSYTLFGSSALGQPVTITLGAVTTLIPATAESVTVEAAPDPLSTPADVFPRDLLQQLPLAARRWQTLAVLTPELNLLPSSVDLLSARGLPGTQNSTALDGLSDDQSYTAAPRGSGRDSGTEAEDETETSSTAPSAQAAFNTGTGAGRHPGLAYTFSESAVREFRVSGENDSALLGHAAGAVITTVSRSGTPDLHGSLFYLNRSDLLAAPDSFSTSTHFHDNSITTLVSVKPHDLRQQFGLTLGGPLRLPPHLLFRPGASSRSQPHRDLVGPDPSQAPPKLLFFYSFDAQRRGFPAISTPQSPTFYALTPIQLALLGNRGVTRAQTTTALNYLDSLTGTADRRQDQTIHFGKLDWLPNDTDRASLQYNRARSASPGGGRSGSVVNRGLHSFGNVDTRVDSVLARFIHAPSSFWSSETRAQYGRDLHLEHPQSPLPQEPAVAANGYAPEVAIGPEGLIFGTPSSAGQGPNPDERRTELAEVLTLSPPHHLLQLGADFSLVSDHIESLSNSSGTFHYDSGTTDGNAGGLVDWISDYTFNVNHTPNGACPSINAATHYFCFRSFSQSFGAQSTRFSTQEWAAFVQDSWRVHPRLSLSAGLRYEYELLPLPQHPNPALDQVFASSGATSVFPEDRNNLGPRLGLAWRPLGRGPRQFTLRAAFGLYFGRLPGATVRSALNSTALPSTTEHIRILPTTEAACPQVSNQGFGYPCAFTTTAPAGTVSTTAAVLFGSRFRLPVARQATLALEQAVGRSTLLRASYHLTLTGQLPNSTDLNIAPSTGTRQFILQVPSGLRGIPNGQTFSLPLYTARVDTAFGPVTGILSNANSSYNALVFELRSALRGGLTLNGSYTWSRSIDTAPNSGAVPSTNGQLDPFNIRYDKGLSAFNYPQKLVASAVLAPHPDLATPRLHALANGWSLAPILVVTSGRPYTYNVFGGSRLPGGHQSINASGGSVYLPTLGRNTLQLPPQLHLDLRLNRDIRLSERSRLRLSAEAFNLPNHTNLTAVSERAFLAGTPDSLGRTPLLFQDACTIAAEGLNTNPFGTPLHSTGRDSQARQLQLGLRLDF